MVTRILKISDSFRDSLEETLDRNDHSRKQSQIITRIKKTIADHKTMKYKLDNNMRLYSDEQV